MSDLDQKSTIYDIAKRANVSISTVSRVFNSSSSVSKKTRRKVEKAIEEMNYIPNAIARSLSRKSSKTIGVIVSDVSNPFFTDIIDGIESILLDEGFTALLCSTGYNSQKEGMYISQMLEKRVDGIIIFSAYPNDADLIFRTKNIIPMVSVQSTFKEIDSVNTDDEKGAYEAVDYLIKMGHRSIAFIVYDCGNLSVSGRMKGYVKAHENNGLEVNPQYIVKSTFKSNSGYHMTCEVLEKLPQVTAIFAYNDKMALDAYLALQAKGLRVPDDMSIMGYDDIEAASLVTPKLTTISQPFYDIGKNAAQLILKRIREEKKSTPQTILFPTKLIERDSVKKLSAIQK